MQLQLLSQLLKGITVLVTGSNRGVGHAIAILATQHGARVICHGRTKTVALESLLAQVQTCCPAAFSVTGDLTQSADCIAIRSQVEALTDTLQGIVCNASGFAKPGPLTRATWSDIATEYEAVLSPVTNPVQVFLPLLTQSNPAVIVCLAATLPQRPVPGHTVHALAKGAVQTYVRQAAREFGPLGIRVIGISPGVVTTDWAVAQGDTWLETIAVRTPLGRVASPEDVAGAVVMALSPLSRFVTGVDIPADGGAWLS